MRNPRNFLRPLAIGAPEPPQEIPARPSRNIHFFDPSNEKLRDRVPRMVEEVDILLGNLEDSIPADKKEEARRGLIEVGKANDFGETQLWTRINSLDSPWFLDDMLELVGEIGDKLDVIMVPKVNGPWDLEYMDQLLAQLEARAGVKRPILVHAILESAAGVSNVEAIARSTPRMHGMSLGPSDLAASRRMKTTRVGGPHPGYLVRSDATDDESASRSSYQQDLWHYTLARMVDACAAAEVFPFYGPFGDFTDSQGCEDQFRNAFILGCVGAWTLHPSQIPIAKQVFAPDPEEVAFARRVLEAMGDGSGVAMVDGKMQDDATYKQCKVMVEVADMLEAKDRAE
ncbi:MAG TPA: CoA ester lyase [Dehalococcoidia bacterium]|nr:CoA ester lyase [Dehalococcoidia bacterium]